MNGILVIDKPEGLTSHDVILQLRRILDTKKIGHTGTLDPFATGVLVLLIGKATRLAKFINKDEKKYEAVLRFGFETDTGDRTGRRKKEEIIKGKADSLKASEIEKALPDFLGEIEQTPPMYSAKKIKGRKLYELARRGTGIERSPIKVIIRKLKIVKLPDRESSVGRTETRPQRLMRNLYKVSNIDTRDFTVLVCCSAGTYVRALAEDIGRKIGVGCHLAELRRISAGKFDISKAISLKTVKERVLAKELDENLISMNEAVSHLPEKGINEEELKRIKNGMKISANLAVDNFLNIRLTDSKYNLVAIGKYEKKNKKIQPSIVLLN